jgi:ppGpp synthetase/RelA/SpoT-type nucleotidyltranferase
MLASCREVMGEEDRVENQDQEGYRSLWEMVQGPVRDTVRFRSLADLENHDGFLNLLRVG